MLLVFLNSLFLFNICYLLFHYLLFPQKSIYSAEAEI